MCTWTTRAAVAATVLAVSAGMAVADTDSSTLDWPVGNHAWIGLNTGNLDNAVKERTVLFDDIVTVNNAAWVRLHFGDTKLDRDSFIRVTSLRDGEVQELDASTLSMWNSSSAYFNGNAVRVEVIGGGLTSNSLSIDTATWELADANRGDGCGICSADDRVPSSDNRFARLMPVGCSATMYNTDSCFVTAGHCLSSADVLEFNVPDSSGSCNVNHPPVADQFPVIAQSGTDGGVGNDYGGMKAGTNSSGQTPYERYGVMVPLASSIPSSGNLTVNGYGVDSECVRSQTQQFCEGPMLSLTGDTVTYNLDVTYGNSGSSILYNGEIIGVVTHCSYNCENYGTRIDTSGFVSARESACFGGGGGGCAAGEIEDCNGNCCPDYWVGDGYCDDGTYSWNGIPIYLNCDAFNCDGGDCTDCGGGDPTGGCCVGTSCSVDTSANCVAMGGTYLGDGTDCVGDPCGGGGGCPAGEIEDCNGNCCPDYWVGDGYCDDGTYSWNGIPIYLNCDAFNCDGGDCTDCGGGDPTGGCCVGTSCSVVTAADCAAAGGAYLGDNTDCSGDPCGGGGGGDGDTCDGAVAASEGANPFDTSANTDSGFGEPDEAQCAGTYLDWSSSPDFWFKWTPGADGTASFSTCDAASYDTSMVLYEGTSCAALTQIACSGDAADSTGCQPYHSQIDGVAVSAGQSYYIRLGGWLAATGAGTLTIEADLGQPAEGACCFGQTCDYIAANTCAANGGMYIGDGVPCSPNPCEAPAQGACCLTDVCEVMDQLLCQDSGGQYQGDGTDCTNDPCGSDLGACCLDTVCHQYSQNECTLQSGTWHGVGSSCDPNPCDVGGGDDVTIAYSIVGSDLLSLDQPNFTVDVFAQMPLGWRLDAVAGNQDQQKTVACSTSFYQDGFGGPTSIDVNPAFYEMAPDLEWDSRVTIGAIDSTGNPFPENTLNQVGIDWTDFEAGGDLSVGNGVWFVIPTDVQGVSQSFIADDCSEQNGVLIARLTAMEMNAEVLVEALFQGRTDTDEVWQAMTGGYITYSGEQDCNLNQVPDACDIANGTSEDANGNGIPDECDSTCIGDVDNDGDTDVDDILAIINGFGGDYNVDDLLTAISDFGCTG